MENNLKNNTNETVPQQPPKIVGGLKPTPVSPAPELASKPNAADRVVPVQKKKPAVKKNINEKTQTVLDVGPSKKGVDFKRIGKTFGLAILGAVVLVGIYVGYQYFVNLTPADVPEEKIRRIRETSERKIDDDPTSLDALEKRFNDFGNQAEITEDSANFESKLGLGRKDF